MSEAEAHKPSLDLSFDGSKIAAPVLDSDQNFFSKNALKNANYILKISSIYEKVGRDSDKLSRALKLLE